MSYHNYLPPPSHSPTSPYTAAIRANQDLNSHEQNARARALITTHLESATRRLHAGPRGYLETASGDYVRADARPDLRNQRLKEAFVELRAVDREREVMELRAERDRDAAVRELKGYDVWKFKAVDEAYDKQLLMYSERTGRGDVTEDEIYNRQVPPNLPPKPPFWNGAEVSGNGMVSINSKGGIMITSPAAGYVQPEPIPIAGGADRLVERFQQRHKERERVSVSSTLDSDSSFVTAKEFGPSLSTATFGTAPRPDSFLTEEHFRGPGSGWAAGLSAQRNCGFAAKKRMGRKRDEKDVSVTPKSGQWKSGMKGGRKKAVGVPVGMVEAAKSEKKKKKKEKKRVELAEATDESNKTKYDELVRLMNEIRQQYDAYAKGEAEAEAGEAPLRSEVVHDSMNQLHGWLMDDFREVQRARDGTVLSTESEPVFGELESEEKLSDDDLPGTGEERITTQRTYDMEEASRQDTQYHEITVRTAKGGWQSRDSTVTAQVKDVTKQAASASAEAANDDNLEEDDPESEFEDEQPGKRTVTIQDIILSHERENHRIGKAAGGVNTNFSLTSTLKHQKREKASKVLFDNIEEEDKDTRAKLQEPRPEVVMIRGFSTSLDSAERRGHDQTSIGTLMRSDYTGANYSVMAQYNAAARQGEKARRALLNKIDIGNASLKPAPTEHVEDRLKMAMPQNHRTETHVSGMAGFDHERLAQKRWHAVDPEDLGGEEWLGGPLPQ